MGIHGIFWRWPTGNKLTMAATSPKSEEGGWWVFERGWEGFWGVNWLMRREEASMRRGGRQKMGPNRAPATAWIGLRHSSAPPQQQKNTCAKYQVFSKFGTKQEIRQCLFLFCSFSNVFVAPVLKSKRLFCVVRKREGLGSQHLLVGGGWASSISSSATSHDIPVQTTNSDSRVWTQRPGKTFWLQNFNNNRIACVEKLSVKSGWGKGKRPTMPLQLSN